MSHIILRPKFLLDAHAIWLFIAKDQVANANDWHNSLNRSLELLASQPRMGKAYPGLGTGIRSHPVGHYLILYKVIAGGIEACRVIHAARNLKKAWHS